MSSEDMGLVPSQRLENGLNSQLVFQEEPLRFNCGAAPQRRIGDPGPKTRELSSFMEDKMFSVERDRYFQHQGTDFRRSIFGDDPDRRDCPEAQTWNDNGRTYRTPSGDGTDVDDDDDDDEDDVDEGDGEVEGLVGLDDINKNNNGVVVHSSANKICNEKSKHHSSFVGSSREVLMNDGSVAQSVSNSNTRASPNEIHHQQGRVGNYQSAITIAEPDSNLYYSQFINASDGSGSGQKDIVMANGCGTSGRKDVTFSSEPGESLRTILSDPLTGSLMDDAMILPCGHSFGGVGIQYVIKRKACYTCSESVSEDSVAPNLSLRAAVQAFLREEDLLFYRPSKRRRDRFEEKGNYGDPSVMDSQRGRGVQFPFVVTDRVIIKGNKRTPQRFVGREAVVTTQCLNGWYVVKTLDNAESVKLQYRSLAKVPDDTTPKSISSKMTPNWL